jgi:Protein of unknown function (DUF4242)
VVVRPGYLATAEMVQSVRATEDIMHRFIIERDIPNIGAADVITLRNTAKRSNETLRQLGGEIQWVESFISGDKIFCVYLAANEDIIRKHSQMSGIPATRIYKVDNRIDPTLATSLVGPVPIGHTP